MGAQADVPAPRQRPGPRQSPGPRQPAGTAAAAGCGGPATGSATRSTSGSGGASGGSSHCRDPRPARAAPRGAQPPLEPRRARAAWPVRALARTWPARPSPAREVLAGKLGGRLGSRRDAEELGSKRGGRLWQWFRREAGSREARAPRRKVRRSSGLSQNREGFLDPAQHRLGLARLRERVGCERSGGVALPGLRVRLGDGRPRAHRAKAPRPRSRSVRKGPSRLAVSRGALQRRLAACQVQL